MLKQVRQTVIQCLWDQYCNNTPQAIQIKHALAQRGTSSFTLDHFAIIDLPSAQTGISTLYQLFSAIGYIVQGRDYLPDKQNDFVWMTEQDSKDTPAQDVLPQVVIADFRLDELAPEVRHIIEKYAGMTKPSPIPAIQQLAGRVFFNDAQAAQQLSDIITRYLAGRDWPLPTIKEFQTVREFNELLAWVLVFGRQPNHFTLSIHLLDQFTSLSDFHRFIENEVQLPLNYDGGVIKGGKVTGIEQGSTAGSTQTLSLADGDIAIPSGFIEFVWRFPATTTFQNQPRVWQDFFTGFIANHANYVIESLYV